jgi:hypothetical protein
MPLLEDRTYVQFGFRIEYVEPTDGVIFIAHLPNGTRMTFPIDENGRRDMLEAALPRDAEERKKLAGRLLTPGLVMPTGKLHQPGNNGNKGGQ